jgi:phosphonate transport system substrate-binding protein
MVALCVLLCVSCTPPPEHSATVARPSVDPTPFVAPADLKKVRFGLIPYFAKESIRRGHTPLGEYLGKSLQVPVELAISDNYGDAIDRLARGEFDLVELSPYAYALAERRVKLRCLVQSILNGSATTTGYIVVRDDSPIRTVEQLKGTQFGFVDPSSTAGYLYAAKALRDVGVDPKRDFATVEFLGNHEAVLLAVYEGRIDAGATFQGAFHALAQSKGIDPLAFRVIAKTPRMPNDVLCVPAGGSPEFGEAIARALLGLSGKNREGRSVLGPLNINGYQAFDDSTYVGVRRIANEVGPP